MIEEVAEKKVKTAQSQVSEKVKLNTCWVRRVGGARLVGWLEGARMSWGVLRGPIPLLYLYGVRPCGVMPCPWPSSWPYSQDTQLKHAQLRYTQLRYTPLRTISSDTLSAAMILECHSVDYSCNAACQASM